MNIKILQLETYLDIIEKSVGSNLFQTVFAQVDGEKKDIVNKGQFSCALHVSSILLWFNVESGLLEKRHVGVSGLLYDMEKSGWYKINKPKVGSIIYWESMFKNGSENEHIGFYIGNDKAISSERDAGTPVEHHYTYGEKNSRPARKIEAIYWHPRLNNKYFQQNE